MSAHANGQAWMRPFVALHALALAALASAMQPSITSANPATHLQAFQSQPVAIGVLSTESIGLGAPTWLAPPLAAFLASASQGFAVSTGVWTCTGVDARPRSARAGRPPAADRTCVIAQAGVCVWPRRSRTMCPSSRKRSPTTTRRESTVRVAWGRHALFVCLRVAARPSVLPPSPRSATRRQLLAGHGASDR
jgi:hypothetical protein